ncbi:MAG: tRNA pseudouridine(55) synthase TruB [Candidatus Omnitrophica bacterium]|nr:tRNA pseudouridine(55) synthase TruB [Candidatus Omnitrophota bacterium]
MDGLINVNKPSGITSYDVIRFFKRVFRLKDKIGHAGTLDPIAEGVLLVCLGKVTRLSSVLMSLEKEYVATLRLGIQTDTLDIAGKVLNEQPVNVSPEEVKKAFPRFQGKIQQVPPSVSALKYQGMPLYKHHRKGRVIQPSARTVFIKEIEVLRVALPDVKFRVVCSRGTYIRALCRDIGETLGCGGTQTSLIRTRIGPFRIDTAFGLTEIEKKGLDSALIGFRQLGDILSSAEGFSSSAS